MRRYFDPFSCDTMLSLIIYDMCSEEHFTCAAFDEHCDFFFPPTEIQAEAESGDRSQKNIGHVFVHRPQQPIPNS